MDAKTTLALTGGCLGLYVLLRGGRVLGSNLRKRCRNIGDADKYAQLLKEISALERHSDYSKDTHEGMLLRDRVVDLQIESERYKAATIEQAQKEIEAEQAARSAAEARRSKVLPRSRKDASPYALAADYKSRGMGRHRAWDQFVIDRDLRPGMDAKDFFNVYDSVDSKPFGDAIK